MGSGTYGICSCISKTVYDTVQNNKWRETTAEGTREGLGGGQSGIPETRDRQSAAARLVSGMRLTFRVNFRVDKCRFERDKSWLALAIRGYFFLILFAGSFKRLLATFFTLQNNIQSDKYYLYLYCTGVAMQGE
jgi:hypothetical protein